MGILTHLKTKNKVFFILILHWGMQFSPIYCENDSFVENNVLNIKNFRSYYMYVSKNSAILRTNPTSYSFEIAILEKGEKVKVLYRSTQKSSLGGINEYWYYIKTNKGYIGWIFGSFLSDKFIEEEKKSIDKNVLKNQLKGIWWEVNDRGETGFRSLEFTPPDDSFKGNFIYKFQNTYKLEGEYYINNDGIIVLNKELSIGNKIELIQTPEGFRLYLKKDEQPYYFKKSNIELENDKNDG